MSLNRDELKYLLQELKKVFVTKEDVDDIIEDKQTFSTLLEMKNCNNVPSGFIAYCIENGKRYEYLDYETEDDITGKWRELKVGLDIDEDLLDFEYAYVGSEEPSDDVIWFDTGEHNVTEIKYENPLIDEIFASIQTLQEQVRQLQADVEYLKINGGGTPTYPDPGDKPDIDKPEIVDVILTLEDGGLFLLEDGGYMILEESIVVSNKPTLSLEDGGLFLLEDGSFMLLENAIVEIEKSLLLLENGAQMLLEDGTNILLENN